ncbi:AAA family ATPase [uncultured Jatrophihabitans sp.]|uniref:ATP-binding protein n=1 Tax=uncultured Jatrophihabitans sp. TaxID=1610747 RepID=UPI0035CC38D4
MVAWGRCWHHDGAPPLWPWIQLLATVAATTPEEELIAALQDRAGPVRALVPDLPSLREIGRAGEDEVSIAQSQVQQFDAITAFLEHLAERRPLLLILEDMHWADSASRRMAEYLVTHFTGRNLSLVCTVRAPTEDPGTTGQDLLGALARTGRCERVSLSGLTDSDVREYVRDRTNADLDDVTARTLVDRTAGNPFFVGEIVRLLVTDAYAAATGATTSGAQIPAEVPDTVREVILQRVHRLDPNEQAVLRTAAVAGSGFDLELIEQVSGLADDVVDEAVDSTTATGFLCSDPALPGRHRFTHALVQQTIAEDVGPARRIRLHGRIADVLRQRADGQPLAHAEDIVYHLVATGTEPNIDLAVELVLRLADAAMARPNYPEADSLLMRALDLVERLSGPTAETREMSTLIRLCSLHDLVHGPALPGGPTLFAPATALRRRALELARRLAGDRDLLAALYGSWALADGTADFVAAAAATEELALVAEATDDELMRLVHRYLVGHSVLQQGRLREAEHNFTAVVDAIADVDTTTSLALLSTPLEATWGWRAVTRVLLGDDVGADADLAVNEQYIGHEHPSVDVNAAACAAFAAVLRDRPDEALPYAGYSVSTSATAGLMAIGAYVSVFRDWARERLDPGSALADLRAALAAFAGGKSVVLRPYLRGLLVDVLERAGDPARLAEATTTLDQAFAEMARNGNEFGRPDLHRLRARVLRRRGDDTEARREDERAAAATAAQQR